jgi:hypothetical protein
MAKMVDHLLNVSATTKTPRIQETHILIGHTICELVDEKMFGDTTRPAVATAAGTDGRTRPGAATTRARRAAPARPAPRRARHGRR